mgnify:CR=1 FL=1
MLRTILAATAASALIAGPAAGIAAADGPKQSDLPAGLVAALQRDLGISPDEFFARSDRAEKFAGFVAQAGGAVSAAWLDNGRPTITLGAGADAVRKLAEKAGITVVSAEQAPRKLSDKVELTGPTGTGEPTTTASTDGGLRGGDTYFVDTPDGKARCSYGFNATDAAGKPVVITAGHCADGASPQVLDPASGKQVGTFAKHNFTDTDWAIINVDPRAAKRFANNEVTADHGSPIAIDGVAKPVVGMPVCKSGTTTGFSCGEVTAVNRSVKVSGVPLQGMFFTSLCALPGDSGGALFSGTKALGITSGGNTSSFGTCKEAERHAPQAGSTPNLIATPVSFILEQNPGVQVRVS